MARVRRNWTAAEDELLRRAVRTAEEEQRPLLWRELAKAVPGRSNKDCRRRWWNSLSEGNAKGPWTEEEDERLTAAVQRHGPNWTLVSRDVKSRSSDQCSSHWSHVLDPNINYCDWDEQEDSDLLHQVHTYGTKWAYIASIHTPIRTTLALKNRYSTLRLKSESAKNRSRQGSSSTDADSSWSGRAASTDTAMTSPTAGGGHWSPDGSHMHQHQHHQHHHHLSGSSNNSSHNSHWGALLAAEDVLKFRDEMDGGETEEDEDDETRTPQDLLLAPAAAWQHHHHYTTNPSSHALKIDTTTAATAHTMVDPAYNIHASFASWDAWAKLNDAAPSDGTHATSCHLSPVEGAPPMGIAETYFSLESPLLLSSGSSSGSSSRHGGVGGGGHHHHQASSLPNYCFFGGEENNNNHRATTTTGTTTTTTGQDALYSLYDDETCRQLSPTSPSPTELAVTPMPTVPGGSAASDGPHTSAETAEASALASSSSSSFTASSSSATTTTTTTTTAKLPLTTPSNSSSVNASLGGPGLLTSSSSSDVHANNGWGNGAGAADSSAAASSGGPSSTPLSSWVVPQFSRHNSLDSLLSPSTSSLLSSSPSSSGYRVSISLTCHPDQLANVMSHMSNYGSGVTFNFQTDE